MRVLLLCAATFAVGLLAGSILWSDGGPPYRRPAPESRGAAGEREFRNDGVRSFRDEDFERDDAPATTAGGKTRGRNASVRELAGSAGDELDRIVSGERAQAAMAGEGKISGTVRDSKGDPVEGVVVTVVPEAQPLTLSLSRRKIRERAHTDRDLSEAAHDAIQGELWRRYSRRVATTGQAGRYELKGLMDSRHSLTAFHEKYEVSPLSKQGRVVPDAVVDFVAKPVAMVTVAVRMPDGEPADYAWLSWQGPEGRGNAPWTKTETAVRIPVGAWRVKAQSTLPEPLLSEEVEHTVKAQPSSEPLVLQLEARRVLTARLVLPAGFVTPRTVEYRLRRLVDGEEEVEPESLLKDQSPRHATAPSPGRVFWLDLEPGKYLVAAFLDKRRLIAFAEAEVGDEAAEVLLEVEEPDRNETVLVKLQGPDGGPVPGQVSFRMMAEAQGVPRQQRVDALQLDDGSWMALLAGLVTKDLTEATLRVGTRDFGAVLENLNLRGGSTITIRFDKPGKLRLKVERYSGSGHEGSLYAALRGERGVSAWGAVKPSGTCELSGVQPGEYQLLLVVRKRNVTWTILQQPMRMRAGEDEHTIAVPVLHTLRVRVPKNFRGKSVQLRCGDPAVGAFSRDGRVAGRVVVFDGLAAGAYEVRYGKKRAQVRVPGPPEVVLK